MSVCWALDLENQGTTNVTDPVSSDPGTEPLFAYLETYDVNLDPAFSALKTSPAGFVLQNRTTERSADGGRQIASRERPRGRVQAFLARGLGGAADRSHLQDQAVDEVRDPGQPAPGQ